VAKLRLRLLEEGYHPEAVEAVIEAMHEQGVHSDRRFAEAWCRDCLLSRAVGPRYLEGKLREAGIAPDLARQAANEAVDPRTEANWPAAPRSPAGGASAGPNSATWRGSSASCSAAVSERGRRRRWPGRRSPFPAGARVATLRTMRTVQTIRKTSTLRKK